jgi:hypothetical protein
MDSPGVSDTLTAFPHDLRANPVFRLEYKRLRWPRTEADFQRYRRNVLRSVLALTFVWWLVGRLTSSRILFTSEHGSQIMLLFLISIAFSLLSSLYAVVTSISSIYQQIESGNWEHLQITPLTGTTIVNAYYAVIQIRARRLTVIEVGLRIAPGMPLLFDLIYSLFFTRGGFTTIFMLVFPPVLLAFGILGWLLYMYLIEPFYRMVILVAIGLAAALTLRNLTGALLVGLIAVALVHLLPLAVLIGLPFALTATPELAQLTGPALVCLIPLGYFAAAYLLFNGYYWLRQKALLLAVEKAA